MTMDPMGFPFQFGLFLSRGSKPFVFQADNDEESQTAHTVAVATPQAQAQRCSEGPGGGT